MEIIRPGMITRSQAEQTPPKAKHITIIINDAESAVSNAEILKLLKLWQGRGKDNARVVHFEKDLKLPHDIITPGTPSVPVDVTHPRLISVIRDTHPNQYHDENYRRAVP